MNIPIVELATKSGRFKYIQVTLHGPDSEQIVIERGGMPGEHPLRILGRLKESLRDCSWSIAGVKGGTIVVDSDQNEVRIFGWSKHFGHADHRKTANDIRDQYPGHHVIGMIA